MIHQVLCTFDQDGNHETHRNDVQTTITFTPTKLIEQKYIRAYTFMFPINVQVPDRHVPTQGP